MVNRHTVERTRRYNLNNRIFLVEKRGRKWEGWFDDDHSVIYEETSLKKLLDEAAGDA